jgi:hypothetical protein
MWLAAKTVFLAALIATTAGQSAREPLTRGTDGHHPAPLKEGHYRFTCSDIEAELRWREERLDPDAVATLRHALRVTLLDLKAPGRNLAASDLARVRELFATFAWVNEVRGWCVNGDFIVLLIVMNADVWVAHIQGDGAEQPDTQLHSIRISAAGAITIDGPGF